MCLFAVTDGHGGSAVLEQFEASAEGIIEWHSRQASQRPYHTDSVGGSVGGQETVDCLSNLPCHSGPCMTLLKLLSNCIIRCF